MARVSVSGVRRAQVAEVFRPEWEERYRSPVQWPSRDTRREKDREGEWLFNIMNGILTFGIHTYQSIGFG